MNPIPSALNLVAPTYSTWSARQFQAADGAAFEI